MTELEKRIYNCWLATTRSKTGKPFKLRKDWKKFEEKPEYYYVKKLAKIFIRYDNIDINEWFQSPYKIYNDDIQYDLKYYTIMKQFNCYRLYMQNKNKRKYTPKEFNELITRKKS